MDLNNIPNPLSPFVNNYDCCKLLQKSNTKFNSSDWISIFKQIPPEIIKGEFLYVFCKFTANNKIHRIYIGKSTTKNLDRLRTHAHSIQGIINKQVLAETQTENDIDNETLDHAKNEYLATRFYHNLIQTSPEQPIYLFLFQWSNNRVINQTFNFSINVNLSNAEGLVISTLSTKLYEAKKHKDFQMLNHDYVSRLKWAIIQPIKKIKMKNINAKIIDNKDPIDLWNDYCNWFIKKKINLFDISLQNIIWTELRKKKRILKLSTEAIKLIVNEVKNVKKSFEHFHENQGHLEKIPPEYSDGLIYIVYVLREDLIKLEEYKTLSIPQCSYIPIYIGKTEVIGVKGEYSVNLENVVNNKNRNFFARWGYDNARHIGGLSHCFYNIKNKFKSTNYENWVKIMFNPSDIKNQIPKLRLPIYFQMKAWKPFDTQFIHHNIFTAELEPYLIALSKTLFPKIFFTKQER